MQQYKQKNTLNLIVIKPSMSLFCYLMLNSFGRGEQVFLSPQAAAVTGTFSAFWM